MSTLKLFMKNIPKKPILSVDMTKWKGEMQRCINEAITDVEEFVRKHPQLKAPRGKLTITESLMSKKENVDFIKKQLLQ